MDDDMIELITWLSEQEAYAAELVKRYAEVGRIEDALRSKHQSQTYFDVLREIWDRQDGKTPIREFVKAVQEGVEPGSGA